jgi:hypothetical protein
MTLVIFDTSPHQANQKPSIWCSIHICAAIYVCVLTSNGYGSIANEIIFEAFIERDTIEDAKASAAAAANANFVRRGRQVSVFDIKPITFYYSKSLLFITSSMER